jgi:hypothetical protein
MKMPTDARARQTSVTCRKSTNEENRRLHNWSEGLEGHMARVEAEQHSAVARLQEAIAAGGSKVKENLSNGQGGVAKLKEDMMLTKRMMRKTFFAPFVKKEKPRLEDGQETDNMYDTSDGILAHLTRQCSGNVHDVHVVNVISGSFEKETQSAGNVTKCR